MAKKTMSKAEEISKETKGVACLLQRQQEVKIMEWMEQLVVIHNQGQMMLANLHRRRHTFKM
jgi:hypothetical protein